VLCFGGTKNGMNMTEAVVFFNRQLAREFDYRCKQAGQLASKMRFLSSQWVGMLQDGRVAAARRARQPHDPEARGRAASYSPSGHPRRAGSQRGLRQPAACVAAAMHARGWHYYNFIGAHGYRSCAPGTPAKPTSTPSSPI